MEELLKYPLFHTNLINQAFIDECKRLGENLIWSNLTQLINYRWSCRFFLSIIKHFQCKHLMDDNIGLKKVIKGKNNLKYFSPL